MSEQELCVVCHAPLQEGPRKKTIHTLPTGEQCHARCRKKALRGTRWIKDLDAPIRTGPDSVRQVLAMQAGGSGQAGR